MVQRKHPHFEYRKREMEARDGHPSRDEPKGAGECPREAPPKGEKRSPRLPAQVYGPDAVATAASLNNLAALLEVVGEWGEAEDHFRRAVEIREAKLGKDHVGLAPILNNIGGLLRRQGHGTKAEAAYARALKIYEGHHGADSPVLLPTLFNLGLFHQEVHSARAAAPWIDRAHEIAQAKLEPGHPTAKRIAALREKLKQRTATLEAEIEEKTSPD